VRPFLLLATRAEDAAADDEYAAFLRFSRLDEHLLRRVRLEQTAGLVGPADLDDFSGVILGGSPFTWSTPPIAKSDSQRRAEAEIDGLLDRIVAEDLPFLGACYGIGTLGSHVGAVVDTTYAEPVSAVDITLTEAGLCDPLTSALPERFEAFVGHKEAVTTLPDHAVHLASSPACPVQAFRVGRNVYATQFHPELDVPGIQTRIDVYKHAGYFRPEAADDLKADVAEASVAAPPLLVQRFVELYAR
jgi:GMP synthase (glutamine-hydrolysing)